MIPWMLLKNTVRLFITKISEIFHFLIFLLSLHFKYVLLRIVLNLTQNMIQGMMYNALKWSECGYDFSP